MSGDVHVRFCEGLRGWFPRATRHNLAQVTLNLNNYLVTPPHILFEAVKEEAAKLKIAVAGSQIVGVVPLQAILHAAEYYIEKEGLFILDEDQKIRLAVERLGLNSVAPFDPKSKIIEYIIATAPNEPLAGMSVRAFIEQVADRSIAPGGGSASAVIAALGAGLGAMVGKLTLGVRKFEAVDAEMRKLIPSLHEAALALIPMIDADTNAFADYVAALGLPENTEKENRFRKAQLELGLKKAIEVPLSIMTLGDKAWDAMLGVAQYGNIASRSDVVLGARALEVGIWGAYRTLINNMDDINDPEYRKKIMEKAGVIRDRAAENCQKILDILEKRSV
ncbi:cyclodeaminase/cyclohydrolase family protein [Desulfobacter postgatei]|uniref:cyclodeaminase/cyclohydrolase family protein n=1 Tax=Desulfobacter postgatei TaxID=2293 RepID=UPI000232C269|nr:cyclodeaminase/cyclohydrolase family protein [Desulfobacter postgatei]